MIRDELEYGPIREHEFEPLRELLAQALHFTPEGSKTWLERVGMSHLRVVRQGGQVAAGLGLLEIGQWFGGARVPVAAITAVGVAPERRGRGVGRRLMHGLLHEVHASGAPISTLYPSTLSFYRAVGYERAGSLITYELPLQAITRRDYALEMELAPPGDSAPLAPIYDQLAQRTPGMFDRGSFIWRAILEPSGAPARTYLITRAGVPEGYLTLVQGGRQDPLRIRDLALLSRAAGERALTFLADHRSIVDQVVWRGNLADPLIALLPEPRYKISNALDWALRIVDVAGALSRRGYPPSLQAELHLDIHDDLLTHNNGRWQLSVAEGRAEVRPGGAGRIKLGIRELAALYSGHLSPAALQFSGALSGSDADLALLALVFSGPPPRLTDPF